LRRRFERLLEGWNEAPGEEDDGGDPGMLDRLGEALGGGEVGCDRLLQEEVLAGPGGEDGELGLHRRRQRDRDRVDRLQHLLEAGEGADAVPLRHLRERRGIAAPGADQLRLGLRREPGEVDGVGPVADAGDAEAEGHRPAPLT
jgi:hypothetical protein